MHKQGNRWAFKRSVVCNLLKARAKLRAGVEQKSLKALLLIRMRVHAFVCIKRSHSAARQRFGMQFQAGENVSDAWLGQIIAALQSSCSSNTRDYAASVRKAGFFESLRAYYFTAGQTLLWKNDLYHF